MLWILKDSTCKLENASPVYSVEVSEVWKVKIFFNVYAIIITNLYSFLQGSLLFMFLSLLIVFHFFLLLFLGSLYE